MDFLRGIPVEHKFETYNMPRTGPTLCHPKNWQCRSERDSALDTLVSFSPLVHINGDNANSPPRNTRHTKLHGDSKHNPHTSSNIRCHLNIPLSQFGSNTNKPKLHESCSIKSKPYSMLQIKNFPCVVKEKFRHFICVA